MFFVSEANSFPTMLVGSVLNTCANPPKPGNDAAAEEVEGEEEEEGIFESVDGIRVCDCGIPAVRFGRTGDHDDATPEDVVGAGP